MGNSRQKRPASPGASTPPEGAVRAKGGVRVELAEIKRNQVTGGQEEEAEGEEGGEKKKQLRRRAGELGEKAEGKVQEES